MAEFSDRDDVTMDAEDEFFDPIDVPMDASSSEEFFETMNAEDEETEQVAAVLLDLVDSSDEEDEAKHGGSKPGKAPNKKRDFVRAHERLVLVSSPVMSSKTDRKNSRAEAFTASVPSAFRTFRTSRPEDRNASHTSTPIATFQTSPTPRPENVPSNFATPLAVNNPYITRKSGCVTSSSKRRCIGREKDAKLRSEKYLLEDSSVFEPSPIKSEEELPLRLGSFERFFAALLRTSVEAYVDADTCKETGLALWRTLCARFKLEVPTKRIQARYENAEKHFSVRAALVLEEARYSLSHELAQRWVHGVKPPLTLRVDLNHVYSIDQASGHSTLAFRKESWFHKSELEYLTPGVVLECCCTSGPVIHRSASQVLLGCVQAIDKKKIFKHRTFDLMLFRPLNSTRSSLVGSKWLLTPVGGTMINYFRQFTAVTEDPQSVKFLDTLLGMHKQDPGECVPSGAESNDKAKTIARQEEHNKKISADAAECPPLFKLQLLNSIQEEASNSFLNSPPKSITIIQGPPGTGKTTLLVSVICRYLQARNGCKRRLMVCAPTNKAVSLLACRFLAAREDPDGDGINMLLTGDLDKLVSDSSRNAKSSPLRPLFVHSWRDVILEEYRNMAESFSGRRAEQLSSSAKDNLWSSAVLLRKRLSERLRMLPEKVTSNVNCICQMLQSFKDGNPIAGKELRKKITDLVKLIEGLASDVVLRELLISADVVFCTLCSAGSLFVRKSLRINDLIVDEAAASSEPELYIPFHLGPERLLVVGDPKQLPATVKSPRAERLGLDVSLHERLMFQCNFPYVMLDEQYRMHPEISSFPSQRFYNGGIANGKNVSCPTYGAGEALIGGAHYTVLRVAANHERSITQSLFNREEAAVIANLVRQLVNPHDRRWCSSDRIRIITFYQAQVELLRKILAEEDDLKGVVVATVDASQGCEADVVIVSFVRGDGTPGFLLDDRRLNVALTRAKHQLICVGNVTGLTSNFLGTAVTLRLLSADATTRKVIKDIDNCAELL